MKISKMKVNIKNKEKIFFENGKELIDKKL